MWLKLPLNLKIIVPILGVQLVVFTLTGWWLVHWSEAKGLAEMTDVLDTRSDAIETAVVTHGEQVVFARKDRGGEIVRELQDRKDFYFQISDNRQGIIGSGGQAAAAAVAHLRPLGLAPPQAESVRRLLYPGGNWLVQVVPVRSSPDGKQVGTVLVAANTQLLLDDGARFARTVVLSGLAMLAATGFGSWWVVTISTRNIGAFAAQIRQVTPPLFVKNFSIEPKSREEQILFDSYGELISNVQSSIEKQQLFIAHASHELKTPYSCRAVDDRSHADAATDGPILPRDLPRSLSGDGDAYDGCPRTVRLGQTGVDPP